jgi:lipopolysaccharide export system protein LptC
MRVLLSNSRLFPLVVMLALALLTFWLERAARIDQGHPALQRHDPDYIVHDFKMLRYGKSGAPESTLTARKMVHYPDDDSTELNAPRVLQTKPGEAPLTLTADRGALSQDGEETFLYDNVLLVRGAIADQPEMRMQTTFLHLVRARSLVRTDRDVSVQEAGRILTGRGLEFDNGSGVLHLREKVRGRFVQRAKQ